MSRMNLLACAPSSSLSVHRFRQMPSIRLRSGATTAEENDSNTIGPS
jgi:hypothetical protein